MEDVINITREDFGLKDASTLSESKKKELKSKKKKYIIHENLIIARETRKTIVYIEKTSVNFPNKYAILKSKIITTSYELLECIYRANVFQDLNDKKEAIVKIEMLNFYLEQALNRELISYKKFQSYGSFLIKIDNMIRSWFKYETSK